MEVRWEFNEAAVWEAYLALHRYFRELPRHQGLELPNRLAQEAPAYQLDVGRRIGARVAALHPEHPLPVGALYYVYLFLFVQVLRCSYRYGPSFVSGIGWSGLAWYPLRSLLTSDDASERAWRHWYYTNWQLPKQKPTESELRFRYPFYPRIEHELIPIVRVQLDQLRALRQMHLLSVVRTFESYTPDGRPSAAAKGWHPWFVAARRETWSDCTGVSLPLGYRSATLRTIVSVLVRSPTECRAFFEHIVPEANRGLHSDSSDFLKETRRAIIQGFDRLVKKMPIRERRAWQQMRTRWGRP